MLVSTEANKMLCKDLFKVGSQKGKAMGRKVLASKLANSNTPISNTNKKFQFYIFFKFRQKVPRVSYRYIYIQETVS